MIQVENITKIYNPKKIPFAALKGISFEVADGELLAIVGKSGSGKSTLMHIMAGLDTATTGKVVVGEEVVTDMKRGRLNQFRNESIGFVFQQFFLFPNENVFENVAYPLRIMKKSSEEISTLVNDMLVKVGLEDKAKSVPGKLSGGQKQRVCIARALVTNPKVVFADEPTGNLDTETGESIEQLLFSMQKDLGTTVIVVTHDDDLAAKCDRVIKMKDGNIE
jgi:putative ABC transport system ATP-binding protein